MDKIKVLHVIKSLGRGGAEVLLPETLKLHNRERFEFQYIYFLPWKDQMVSRIEEAGSKVTCFPARNNFQLLLQQRKVMKYCESNGIDLIHCHLPWAGFLGRLVYAQTKMSMVYTEHNMQERYHFLTKKINRLSFNSQSIALGVSEDVTKSIIKNIKPDIPVRTVLNGTNTTFFKKEKDGGLRVRKELGIPQDAIVIGNVAVFRFQKRLEEWLEVFKDIESKNRNVFGIIVGAGQLEHQIKLKVKKLKLENKVFFPGLQTEVKPFLSAMDIFMMSSSFEGLPIALLEAMSMECAIVSTDAGGIKEVIRNGEDGLTCQLEEWQELSTLCMELIEDPEKLRRMKLSARTRVETSFSLSTMVKNLEEIYEEILIDKKLE